MIIIWPTGCDAYMFKALTHTWRVAKIHKCHPPTRLLLLTAPLAQSVLIITTDALSRSVSFGAAQPLLSLTRASFCTLEPRQELFQRGDKALSHIAGVWKEVQTKDQGQMHSPAVLAETSTTRLKQRAHCCRSLHSYKEHASELNS